MMKTKFIPLFFAHWVLFGAPSLVVAVGICCKFNLFGSGPASQRSFINIVISAFVNAALLSDLFGVTARATAKNAERKQFVLS
ncbi:hypothetical protein L596_025357 [Steinernema carpocapsae]|uniref:Uncharacterized protein n=1 Tax=Steinernema carpocapsae TaxID=34508 RepID=A0A4U5M7J3_STECR|nr:hypothetical protein L596_025357 [Steinernema carpocapsae]